MTTIYVSVSKPRVGIAFLAADVNKENLGTFQLALNDEGVQARITDSNMLVLFGDNGKLVAQADNFVVAVNQNVYVYGNRTAAEKDFDLTDPSL